MFSAETIEALGSSRKASEYVDFSPPAVSPVLHHGGSCRLQDFARRGLVGRGKPKQTLFVFKLETGTGKDSVVCSGTRFCMVRVHGPGLEDRALV